MIQSQKPVQVFHTRSICQKVYLIQPVQHANWYTWDLGDQGSFEPRCRTRNADPAPSLPFPLFVLKIQRTKVYNMTINTCNGLQFRYCYLIQKAWQRYKISSVANQTQFAGVFLQQLNVILKDLWVASTHPGLSTMPTVANLRPGQMGHTLPRVVNFTIWPSCSVRRTPMTTWMDLVLSPPLYGGCGTMAWE